MRTAKIMPDVRLVHFITVYFLNSTRDVTDQFCGPYSIARPAKFERFLPEPPIDLRYNEYLTNLVFLGPSTLAIFIAEIPRSRRG